MDELAQSVKLDPLEFRLKNAKDERLRNVIVAASDKFGWKARQKTAGRGFGIAAGLRREATWAPARRSASILRRAR
jgi:isoquinoline 1-oxidoreductase